MKATSTNEGEAAPVPSIFLIRTAAEISKAFVASFICHFPAVSPALSVMSFTSTRNGLVLLGPPVASSVMSYGE